MQTQHDASEQPMHPAQALGLLEAHITTDPRESFATEFGEGKGWEELWIWRVHTSPRKHFRKPARSMLPGPSVHALAFPRTDQHSRIRADLGVRLRWQNIRVSPTLKTRLLSKDENLMDT